MMHGITKKEFLERALTSAGEWARFADPKALAVLVILGLGLHDLVGRARAVLLPPDTKGATCHALSVTGQTCGQVAAEASFVLALGCAALTVLFVTLAVFPRLSLGRKHAPSPPSLFFFEDVSKFASGREYGQAVEKRTPQELEEELASQVFAVATVASKKHRYATRAYLVALGFLILWVATRLLAALTG